MQAFIDFFTGALNDFAWLYMFLPCVMVGGILLTVRTKAVQFSHFGYAMKNTVGKMFKKTEAGKGAVTQLQAVTTALAATVGTRQYSRYLAGHRPRRLRRCVLAVGRRTAWYGHKVL